MFELLLLAQINTANYFCYQINEVGNIVNLEPVCDPEADTRAQDQAELNARIQQAIVNNDPMYCEFLLDSSTRNGSSVSAQASIDIPVVCTALRAASGVNVSMTLRANGNQLIGSAYETVGEIRSTDNYRFEATFVGDYIPPISALELEYTISGN